MKKFITAMLAAGLLVTSSWAVRQENAISDRLQNKGGLGAYDIGTGQLIPLNIRLNSLGDQIVDGGTNTFTVMGVSLDAIEVAVEAIEGASNTMVVHQAAIEIAVEAIEGASNTQVVHQAAIEIAVEAIEGAANTAVAHLSEIEIAIEADGILAQNIQGATPDGEANTANAVVTGGEDQDGNVRANYVCKDGSQFIKTNSTVLDNCDAATGFTAISDADTIAASTTHIAGSNALSWDKGSGSNVISAVQKTITTTEIVCVGGDQVGYLLNIPDATALTDIEYTFIRIGEDSSNYLEWQIDDEDLLVGWNTVLHSFQKPTSQTGNGTSTGNAKYIAVGCETDDAADTITGLIIDEVVLAHTAKTAVVEAIADVIDLGVVRNRDGATNDRLNIGLDVTKNASYVQSESLASAAAQADMGLQLGVIEGNGTTAVARLDTALLQLGVIEGNGTTGVAHLSVIEDKATTILSELQAQSLQLGVIEGNGTTGTASLAAIEAEQLVQSLQLGVIEGNGTTGTASLAAIEAEQLIQSLQLGVIEGNGTTAVARLDSVLLELGAIEGNGNTLLAEVESQSLQLGVIEGNGTTGTAHLSDIKDAVEGTGVNAQQVQGAAADGAAAVGNPVQFGGVDSGGNAQALAVSEDGAAEVAQHGHIIDAMEATTGWAALNDAANIATDSTHIEGSLAVLWDKSGGSNVDSAIAKTITTLSNENEGAYQVVASIYIPTGGDLTDTNYVYIRLGEDSTNYLQWQTEEASLEVGWNTLLYPMTVPTSQTGNGMSTGNIKYAVIGIVTDNAADTITGMIADNIRIEQSLKNTVVQSPATDVDVGSFSIKDGNGPLRADVDNDGGERALFVQSNSSALEAGGNLDDIATDTGTIDADTSTIAGAVAAGQMQVDVVAELPAGTQEIGKVDIDDISSGTQTNDVKITMDTEVVGTTNAIVDGWDATSGAGISTDGPQVMANYDSTKPTVVTDAQAVAFLADAYGRLLMGVEPEGGQETVTSADATGATQVVAKTAGKRIHILYLDVSTDTAMNIQFQDDSGGPVVIKEQQYYAANGGATMLFSTARPLIVPTNQDLDVIASAAGNISVTVIYYLAP